MSTMAAGRLTFGLMGRALGTWRSRGWRLALTVGLLGGLGGLALGMHVPAQPYAGSLRVTFYNCGAPYPCEEVENTSDADVTLTVRNTFQRQTVTVPAHRSVQLGTDARDNLEGSPTP